MRSPSVPGWLVRTAGFLLLCQASVGLAGPSLDEDVRFGRGLIQHRFYELGVEVLEARFGELRTVETKEAVCKSLIAAHKQLAARSYAHLARAAEQKRKAAHRRKVEEYTNRLERLRPVGDKTVEYYIRLRDRANQSVQQYAGDKSPEAAKKRQQAFRDFEAAIDGMEALCQGHRKKIEAHEEKEPDWEKKSSYKRWEKDLQDLQQPYVLAAVELNRTRYLYYRALPPEKKSQRQKLLKTVIEQLEEICTDYDSWPYTVLGRLTLGKALVDAGKFDDALESFDAGTELIDEWIAANPRIKKEMTPWRNKLLAGWAAAAARREKFGPALAKIRGITGTDVAFTRGEIYLMRAQHLARTKDAAGAKAEQRRGKQVLEQVAQAGEYWRRSVNALYVKYGLSGSGYYRALMDLEKAYASGKSRDIIRAATDLLRYPDTPDDKRLLAYRLLARHYRAERLYHEATVVYWHLSGQGGDHKETYARIAVSCLQKLFDQTKQPWDRRVLADAKKQLRSEFGGPGAEYDRAMELKADGRYADAIREFKKVKKDSHYYEAALEQVGECHVLEAKRVKEEDAARSREHRAKGRKALREFLDLTDPEKVKDKPHFEDVARLRERLRGAAVYRLATLAIWEAEEKAPKTQKAREQKKQLCTELIESTEGYAKSFPKLAMLFPYVAHLRARAFLGRSDLLGLALVDEKLGREEADRISRAIGVELEKAAAERERLVGLARDAGAKAAAGDKEQAKRKKEIDELVAHVDDLLFYSYDQASLALRREAETRAKLAAKLEEGAPDGLDIDARADDPDKAFMSRLATDLASIVKDPKQPFSKWHGLIARLERANRPKQLAAYLEKFLDHFRNDKSLTDAQKAEWEAARTTLALAYYDSSQYRRAYPALRDRFKGLAEQAPGYWQLRLALARTLTQRGGELTVQGNELTRKAIELAVAAIGREPEDYPRWYFIVVEYHRLKQPNDLKFYLEKFLARFGSRRKLSEDDAESKKRRVQVKNARSLLGIAYFDCGEYENACKTLEEQLKPLKADSPRYWMLKRYLAKSAVKLAAGNDARWEQAMALFVELRKGVKRHTDDWWDATVSIVELRGMRDQHQNILVGLTRYVGVGSLLGGPEIRLRYGALLRDIIRRGKPEHRDRARKLLVAVELAGLRELKESKKYGPLLALLERLQVEIGEKESRGKLAAVAAEVAGLVEDPALKEKAAGLAAKFKE